MQYHFIAIGENIMCSLVLALQSESVVVTGSDDAIYEPSNTRLQQKGLLPAKVGWFPDKITTHIDAVILGADVKADNPELIKARKLEIPVFSYPEFIFEQSKHKTRVVIGGSHGKTTLTAMILHVLNYHEKEVDYVVSDPQGNDEKVVHLTPENDFILLEGDEYSSGAVDGRPKFHLYKPNIALISGISRNDVNIFPTPEEYISRFKIFIDTIVKGGILVYNEEDEVLKRLAESTGNPIRKHPYTTPSYQIRENKTFLETPEGDMPIEIFGKHNLSNLAGAKWICQHMGIDEDDFYEAIGSFSVPSGQ